MDNNSAKNMGNMFAVTIAICLCALLIGGTIVMLAWMFRGL